MIYSLTARGVELRSGDGDCRAADLKRTGNSI
jgi:hypothetical protein